MRVLVVDDEIKNAELTALALGDAGHETAFVNGSARAIERMEAAPFDAVVTDLRMAPPDGLALLEEIKRRWPDTTVVLMTAYASMDTARRALKSGAYDYVDKSGEFRDELAAILDKAARARNLELDNRRLIGTVDSLTKGLATIVGESRATRQAVELARKVAATDSTVLLRGESGTGKDLFARAIHFSSRRAGGPWVKVNCGALPENLLESELFGHERGAFTGAIKQKPGRFEDADQGTLFLDEIGELPITLQVKLLQVIEEKRFTRVGGNKTLEVDVRLIAATNRDLEAMTRERQFREDLFFRLNVFPIRLPSLRERLEDVPGLVDFFMRRRGSSADTLTPGALQALGRYAFPGNVRELEHTLERASILAGADPIDVEHLSFARPEPSLVAGHRAGAPSWVPIIPPEGLSLEDLERELILQALERAGGNKSQAARLLGLTRRTLYSRMERYGLRKPGEGEDAGADSDDATAPAGEGAVSLVRLLFDNLGLKLVALLLAVLVYLNVYTERPATLVVSFPIQLTDVPDSLAIAGPAPTAVQAELRGTGKQLIRLWLTEPRFKISLAGIGPGHFERRVSVDDLPLISSDKLKVERLVNPELIDIKLEHKLARRLPVAARVSGVPRSGAVWNGQVLLDPATVIVRGPHHAVSTMDSVRLATVDIGGSRDSVKASLGAIDLPDWTTIEPAQVSVRVPITHP